MCWNSITGISATRSKHDESTVSSVERRTGNFKGGNSVREASRCTEQIDTDLLTDRNSATHTFSGTHILSESDHGRLTQSSILKGTVPLLSLRALRRFWSSYDRDLLSDGVAVGSGAVVGDAADALAALSEHGGTFLGGCRTVTGRWRQRIGIDGDETVGCAPIL